MKLHVLAASLAALTLTAGFATAQTKPATPATPAAKPAAAPAAVDKTHASYAFGWSLGNLSSRSKDGRWWGQPR